jgi:hypothetical protein
MRATCGCLVIGRDDSGFVVEFCNLHHGKVEGEQVKTLLYNIAFPTFSISTH